MVTSLGVRLRSPNCGQLPTPIEGGGILADDFSIPALYQVEQLIGDAFQAGREVTEVVSDVYGREWLCSVEPAKRIYFKIRWYPLRSTT